MAVAKRENSRNLVPRNCSSMSEEGDEDDSNLSYTTNSTSRWRFVIFFGTSFMLFLDAGICKSFGVLLAEMVERFDASYTIMAFICSLPSLCMYLPAIFLPALMARMSPRVIATTGGIVAGAALILSPYSPNLALLGTLFAVAGFGMCLTSYPLFVGINEYFTHDYVFWSSCSHYGYIAGAFVMPLIVERSLEAYGFHGAFLIMGGLVLNSAVCGAAIRSRSSVEKRARSSRDSRSSSEYRCQRTRDIDKEQQADVNAFNEPTRAERGFDASTTVGLKLHTQDIADNYVPSLNAVEAFATGLGLTEEISSSDETANRNCETSRLLGNYSDIGRAAADGDREKRQRSTKAEPSKVAVLSDMGAYFKTTLFYTEPLVIAMMPSIFLYTYVWYAWFLFLVPHAEWLGIPLPHAVLLSTIAGTAGGAGRFVFLIFEHYGGDILIYYTINSTLSTLIFFTSELGSGYSYLALCTALQGALIFSADVFPNTVVKIALCDPKNFNSAMALLLFIISLSSVAGDMMSGYIFDMTGFYTVVFFHFGGINAVITIFVICFVIYQKVHKK